MILLRLHGLDGEPERASCYLVSVVSEVCLELVLRYPTPIRLRPLSLLAISLLTSSILLDPDWTLLVGLLVALVLVVVILLGIAVRFVRHRWATARAPSTLESALCLRGSDTLAVRSHKETHRAAVALYSRYMRPTGSTRIFHYRIRDDLLDSTVSLNLQGS